MSDNRSLSESDLGKDAIQQKIGAAADAIVMHQQRLDKDEVRILEHFWNAKKRRIRESVPLSVLYFLESDDWNPSLAELIQVRVRSAVLGLEIKKHVERRTEGSEAVYNLAPKGTIYLTSRHPGLLAWYLSILELVPASVYFWAAVIGIVTGTVALIDLFGRFHR